MKSIKLDQIAAANARLENIRPSHNEASKVNEGWACGKFEKEITNYDGYGPSIKVYGRTKEEAEAMALILCRKMTSGSDTTPGEYNGISKHVPVHLKD